MGADERELPVLAVGVPRFQRLAWPCSAGLVQYQAG